MLLRQLSQVNNVKALPLNGPNGEACFTWAILAALFLVLVLASVIALWRASRVHKPTFDAPKGLDWGKITGTFLDGRLVFVQTQYPVNPVQVKRYGIKGSTIDEDRGTVPPLTVRNKKASDSLLGHQITGFPEGEERQAANEQQQYPRRHRETGTTWVCPEGAFEGLDSYEIEYLTVAKGDDNGLMS